MAGLLGYFLAFEGLDLKSLGIPLPSLHGEKKIAPELQKNEFLSTRICFPWALRAACVQVSFPSEPEQDLVLRDDRCRDKGERPPSWQQSWLGPTPSLCH